MANERRIVELVLKAVGSEELQRMARDMSAVRQAADQTNKELASLNKSFLGVSAAAAGAFVGNKIQEGLRALISTVSDAVTEMNELAEAGEAAGSGLSAAAVGGAVELSEAVEELGSQVDSLIKEFVGGLAPALTLIVKELTGAIGGMDGFFDAGRAVGGMIADQLGQFNKAVATLGAYAQALSFAAQTANHAAKAWDAALDGQLALSDAWMKSAQASARAAAIYATSAQEIGQAAYNATQAQYRLEQSAAGATGFGTASGAKGKGSGSKGGGTAKGPAAKATEELTWQDRLYADTMAIVNDQISRRIELTGELSDEIKAALQWGAKLDELARQRQEAEKQQAEALERAKEQWGFVADAMGQATYDIISGTEKIGQAVKRMVASIVADLVRLAAQKLIMKLLGVSDFGNSGSALFGKIFGSAQGNIFGKGGMITAPTLHSTRGGGIGIAGESGPEAILPLARNASGQLGVASPGLNVTVNNNVPGAAVGVRQTDQGLQIDMVERQLANRVRRGGSALPGALENTYRNGRFASAY